VIVARRAARLPNVPAVRFSSRRSDADADVIRARLRALLEQPAGSGGWVPELDDEPSDGEPRWPTGPAVRAAPAPTDDAVDDVAEPDSPELPPGIGRHRAPGRATRWDPGRGGARSLWIAGLVAALLLVGWTWLDRPSVEPARTTVPDDGALSAGTTAPTPPVGEAADTSAVVVVSVVGLVVRPGLVTLPAGSRVADAIAAAGGLLPEADAASVNLAALVPDGAQIAVGVPGAGVGPGSAGAVAAGGAPAAGSRVDLNAATAAELDALPGIGPVLAQRIVDHRTRNGPFRSVDQLDDVPGIGPAIAAELAELVAV
jgi:competence protein ComEA